MSAGMIIGLQRGANDLHMVYLMPLPSSLASLKSRLVSEREITFTFAICCRPSICLSVICNVRAHYSGGSNFPQYFYGI